MNQYTKKFCNKYHITEAQYYGKELINKSLIINEDKIPQGFNPKTKYNLHLYKLKEISGNFSPIIGCSLFLTSIEKISGNFNPVVGYDLHLDKLKEISGNFNPVVKEDLILTNLEKISGNFNPVVGESLYMNKIKKLPSNLSMTIGYSLSLNSLEKIPDNFNPVVGNNLCLKLKKLPKNFNPKVDNVIKYNLTGSDVYNFKYNHTYISTNKPPSLLSWQNGKYIKVDGIFSEVEWKRGKVYKLKDIYCSNRDLFLVTDGNDNYAHGLTIKEAKKDLLFKINKNKNLDSYKLLKLDSKLSFKKAIECYRLITGACEYGVKNFIETNNIKNKNYTIKEIIDLTKNQYRNNEFEQFFNN